MPAVIFDFNGTMLFDESIQEQAWQQYISERSGHHITPEEFLDHVHGRNTGDTLAYFFGRPFSPQEADAEEAAEEAIYRALCLTSPDYHLAAGLPDFLDHLVQKQIPITIATASCLANVQFFFDTLGLQQWFAPDAVVYNDGTLPGKPAPDLYLKAAQVLHTAPEHCIVFEDSPAGILSAKAAGAGKVIGVASMQKHSELVALGADAVIQDFTDSARLAELLAL